MNYIDAINYIERKLLYKKGWKHMRFTKETLRKTLRTFFQAFVPCFGTGLVEMLRENGSITYGAMIVLIIPPLSAGLCAIMNLED